MPHARPAVVAVAAAVSALYAVGLVWFGGSALVVLARTGAWGSPVAARGMVFVGLAGLGGAALLAVGAAATLRGRYRWTRVPLGVVLVVGAIGETADLLGTADPGELLTGVAILAGAALPLVLLATPPARAFAAEQG